MIKCNYTVGRLTITGWSHLIVIMKQKTSLARYIFYVKFYGSFCCSKISFGFCFNRINGNQSFELGNWPFFRVFYWTSLIIVFYHLKLSLLDTIFCTYSTCFFSTYRFSFEFLKLFGGFLQTILETDITHEITSKCPFLYRIHWNSGINR